MHAGCPHCGSVLDIDAQYAGHVVTCSACKQQFRAPAQAAASPGAILGGGGMAAGPSAGSGGLLGGSPAGANPPSAALNTPAAEPAPKILKNRPAGPIVPRLGNAFEALLDFGFRTQGSASLVKLLYGLTFLSVTVWLVVGFFVDSYYFVERLRILSDFKDIVWAAYNFALGELLRLLFTVFTILWTRVACEVAPALLRLTDLAAEIERNTKK